MIARLMTDPSTHAKVRPCVPSASQLVGRRPSAHESFHGGGCLTVPNGSTKPAVSTGEANERTAARPRAQRSAGLEGPAGLALLRAKLLSVKSGSARRPRRRAQRHQRADTPPLLQFFRVLLGVPRAC